MRLMIWNVGGVIVKDGLESLESESELDGGAGEQHMASSRASKTAEGAPSEAAVSGSFPLPAQAGKHAL